MCRGTDADGRFDPGKPAAAELGLLSEFDAQLFWSDGIGEGGSRCTSSNHTRRLSMVSSLVVSATGRGDGSFQGF